MKNVYAILLLIVVLLAACTADESNYHVMLTPDQQQLIGQRVDFSATMSRPFTTRTTYQSDGSFNEGDQLRIFRQYAIDASGTTFDAKHEIFRTYHLKADNAPGTSVSFNSDWVPLKGKLKSDFNNQDEKVIDFQTDADSLTWENGMTVRFRAWGRSNLAGAIMADSKDGNTKGSYYPDYTVSDWVTVSGPTQNIPLTMRHLACRIGFVPKPGNELSEVKMCLDKEDYAKDDDYNAVMEVYNKMCMPAGVDDETFLLTAMTKQAYEETNDFRNIEQLAADKIVKLGALSDSVIASAVQHPVTHGNNGNFYLVTIPIDMSESTSGQELVLPACTRFKVKLYSVNDGETYHTFELGKVMKNDQGLKLKAGYSYSFSVGYRYNSLTVTPADSFSWDENTDATSGDAVDKTSGSLQLDTVWFKQAYQDALALSESDKNTHYPAFKISTASQLYTLMALANGTALNENEQIAYPVYHPSVANQGPSTDTVVVEGPLDFNHCEVTLANDIDLEDVVLPGIAIDENHPFLGHFNGNGYTLRNLNLQNEYLFGYVKNGVITNLKIESIYPVCLLNKAVASSSTTGWGCYIAGVSMLCPSTTNSIAKELNGTSWVAGSIHIGKAGGALIGKATNLNMVGCMQAARGIAEHTGALLGSGIVNQLKFKYNYYDIELSPNTTAIGDVEDNYKYDDYIRGSKTHILKAVNDYIVSDDILSKMSKKFKAEVYGMAPWKAMNLGIAIYNATDAVKGYKCLLEYEASDSYNNRYPVLTKKKL